MFERPQITIIDTFGFFFRAFYALPNLHSSAHFPTGLLSAFANLIHSIYTERAQNSHIAFALEGGGVNRRKILSPTYKQNRAEPPAELIAQLPIAIEWIGKMGLVNVSIEGYEADDIIASVAKNAGASGFGVRIISSDKDLYQLISPGVFIYDSVKKREIREAECVEKFGVAPAQFIDYQSIVGDGADNVSGIKGIGPKGALKLISHFGSLEAMYERENELESVLSARLAQIVRDSKEAAFLSKKLVTLEKNLLSSFNFQACEIPAENPLLKIADELEKYELNAVLKKIGGKGGGSGARKTTSIYNESSPKFVMDANIKIEGKSGADSTLESTANSNLDSAPAFTFTHKLIESKTEALAILDSIPKNAPIAFDTETNSVDTRVANIVGFSFCVDGKNGFYVALNHAFLGAVNSMSHDEASEILSLIFTHPLIGHNLKFDLQVVEKNFGITPKSDLRDSMILAWLLNPSAFVGLDKLMARHFNHAMISFESVVGSEKNFAFTDTQKAAEYAAEDAVAAWALYHKLESIAPAEMLKIAREVEFPFIAVLVNMERNGIKINQQFFGALEAEFRAILDKISEEIFSLVGEKFNINSPKQLGEILFNKLGLPHHKSTSEEVLLSLKDAHPVIEKLLSYREFSKLLSTYVAPLLSYASRDKNSRIYTSFLQTGTATGRLSSKSPNLQNIPVRTEVGKKIRAGFCAESNNALISVDYSQIELRLLAHFSADASLVAAFQNGRDIHLETASMLFGEADAAANRHIAKSINFGLIYGMGARRLAETLGCSNAVAKGYIDAYFERFPTVRDFLAAKKSDLESTGVVKTLLGRVRRFDFAGASERLRAEFIREGVNTIFQGSAADLMKLAMLEIYRRFCGESSDSRVESCLVSRLESRVDFMESRSDSLSDSCVDSADSLSDSAVSRSDSLSDSCVDSGSELKMLLQVHDELIFEAPAHKAEFYASEISKIMNNIYALNVPLETNTSIGVLWSELK